MARFLSILLVRTWDSCRCDGLHLNRFCGDARDDSVRRHVLRSDAQGADESMLGDGNAAHDSSVIGDARFGADLRLVITDNHAVIEVVIMCIDVGIVRDGAALMDNE